MSVFLSASLLKYSMLVMGGRLLKQAQLKKQYLNQSLLSVQRVVS
nr:hypothetical protein [Providencia sp. PROV257]